MLNGAKPCGAKCRTKNGAPCSQPQMQNGRCRMHGGTKGRTQKHGRESVNANAQRKQEKLLLREMKNLSNDINNILE